MLEANSLGSKQEQLSKEQLEVGQVLNKHLMDNVIIHSDNEFIETDGPHTMSAKTVTYCDNESNNTRFVEKNEGLSSTVVEVIAGSLYKALLYNRSPTFTLVEPSNKRRYELKLKSKFLNGFVTLDDFMYSKQGEKLLNLIYEKSADENEEKELMMHLVIAYSSVNGFIEGINYITEAEKHKEFCDNITKQLNRVNKNTLLKDLPIFEDILT